MKKRTLNWGVGLALMVGVSGVQADILFDFNNGTGLDDVGAGATMTATNETTLVTRTITSVSVTDALGAATETNVKSSWNALGIRGGNDNFSFELGESWVFKFDEDVELVNLDMAGITDGTNSLISIRLSSSEFGNIDYVAGTVSGDTADLGNTFVSGGTEITLTTLTAGDGVDAGDDEWRMPYLTVQAVPEPGTLGLLSACAIGAFALRRFRV